MLAGGPVSPASASASATDAAAEDRERHVSSLFVVGDVDQAIYGWRGADPDNMRRRLAGDFPEVLEWRLTVNPPEST